jgi:hypothetical protein
MRSGIRALVHLHTDLTHQLLLFQGSAMQNGHSNNNETVASIKERAKEKAFSVTKTKGISAISLMRLARDSAFEAQKAEDSGDLKKSLGLLVQTTSLLSALYDTADFGAESKPGKKGAIYKEVTEWMQVSFSVALRFERFEDHNSHSTGVEPR